MLAVARSGDPTSCAGVAINSGSNVRINGLPVHRLGDTNTCGFCSPPGSAPVTSASLTVRANSIPVARIGDTDGCVGAFVGGSPNVRAG